MRRKSGMTTTALAVALLAAGPAGCDGHQPQPLRIGLLVAQTGPDAARGHDLLNGATLAADEIDHEGYLVDGHPLAIVLRAADDHGDAATARMQAAVLLDAGVDAVIGPLNSTPAAAVIPLIAARGLPDLTTATATRLVALGRGNVLRLIANDDVQARAMAALCADVSPGKHIATIALDDDDGRALRRAFDERLRTRSLAPPLAITSGADGALPLDVVARLRAAHVDTVAMLAGVPPLTALLDALTAAGAHDVTVVGDGTARTLAIGSRPLAIHALYATATAIDAAEFPEGKDFVARFRVRFGTEPAGGAHLGYDAVYALADAARRAPRVDGPHLLATLKAIEPNTRVDPQMRFLASGELAHPAIGVYKMDGGRWELQTITRER